MLEQVQEIVNTLVPSLVVGSFSHNDNITDFNLRHKDSLIYFIYLTAHIIKFNAA